MQEELDSELFQYTDYFSLFERRSKGYDVDMFLGRFDGTSCELAISCSGDSSISKGSIFPAS